MIGKHKTENGFEDGYFFTRYWSTKVVQYNETEIILRNGGWNTSTTKKRINRVSWTENLGFTVFQKDHFWFVEYKGETIPFENGMKLAR